MREIIFKFASLLSFSTLKVTEANINVIIFIWDPGFVLTSVRHFPEISSVT